jgi:hypothetical protein
MNNDGENSLKRGFSMALWAVINLLLYIMLPIILSNALVLNIHAHNLGCGKVFNL